MSVLWEPACLSIAATPHLEDLFDDPRPAWLWDVDRHKIAWGNGAAIAFWGEDGLLDLIEREFDPNDPIALQIDKLAHQQPGHTFLRRLEFDLAGKRTLTACRIHTLVLDDGCPGALLVVEPETTDAGFSRLGQMVQEAPLPMLLFSDTGNLLHQNNEAENIFSTLGLEGGLAALVPATEEPSHLIAQTIRAGTVSRSLPLTTRTGPRTYRITLRRVIDPETRSHALLLVARDIGDRRTIETFQNKRSDELQQMLNHVSDFQWRLDADMRFTRLTGRFEDVTGIKPDTLLGKSWDEAFSQLDMQPSTALSNALETRAPWRDIAFSWQPSSASHPAVNRADMVHLSLAALPLTGRDGHFTGWNGVAVLKQTTMIPSTDIATPPEALSSLPPERTGDAVLLLDRAGIVVRTNAQAEQLFGAITGHPFTSPLEDNSRVRVKNYLNSFDLPATGPYEDPFSAGIEIQSSLHPTSTLLLTLRPIGSEHAGAAFTALVRDISQLQDTEAALRRALNLAKESSAQKSTFLASIAHELRTPLNAIIGFSEVMRDERFGTIGSEKYLSYAADIHESGTLLLSLINDLLDLSKIDAGKFEPQFEQVDVEAVITQCVNMVKPAAADERIAIRTQIAPNMPHLVADKRSLIQILLNLLSNAVKFTRAGGQVTVTTALSPEGNLTLGVQDTGVGMSEEDLDRAFVPFGQARHTALHKMKGTGLGLPLSKALTTANRGTLKIETSPGNGTLVQLAFPSTQVLQD